MSAIDTFEILGGIEPELVKRFHDDTTKLWPAAVVDPSARLGLAVSGGPDSLALLALACSAFPGRIEALTVDHGLRPESIDEAAMVAKRCAELRIRHQTVSVKLPSGNVQEQAREARYDALMEWAGARGHDLGCIVTAHHADDQAETLLMRLNRGSGLPGLAGVRARRQVFPTERQCIPLLRPLLNWRKDELVSIVKALNWPAVDDPSNTDDRYDRARIRKHLASQDWLDPLAVAQSAGHLAEALGFLEWSVEQEWRLQVSRTRDGFSYISAGHRVIEIEVLQRIFSKMGRNASRSDLANMCERLQNGQNASLGGLLATVDMVRLEMEAGQPNEFDRWSFRPEPPRKTA